MSYSWLTVPPPTLSHLPLSKEQKKRLTKDRHDLGRFFSTLEKKLQRYQMLCERFEKEAGKKAEEKVVEQMEKLHHEIDHLTKDLKHTLKDTLSITHEER